MTNSVIGWPFRSGYSINLVHRRIQKIQLTAHYLIELLQNDLIGLFASMH